MNKKEQAALRSIAVGGVGVTLEAADVSCPDTRTRYAENALYEYLVGALQRRGLTIVSGARS